MGVILMILMRKRSVADTGGRGGGLSSQPQ